MPLPKPSDGQNHDDFMESCMSSDIMSEEYSDEKQRYAVCESQWKNKRGKYMENIERRIFPTKVELRKNDTDDNIVVGYSAVFNKQSVDLGGFTEIIAPGAFKEALKNSDARALFNHDPNIILGRESAGTLKLTEDETGLFMENTLPNTNTGRDLAESVRRGDIQEQSFGFVVKKDTWQENHKTKEVIRTINEIHKLVDVSLVTYPAYPDTSVATRSLNEFKKINKTADAVKKEEPTLLDNVLKRCSDLQTKIRKLEGK